MLIKDRSTYRPLLLFNILVSKKEFEIIKQHYGSEFLVENRKGQENPNDKVKKLSEAVRIVTFHTECLHKDDIFFLL